ncbi:MAG: hypothetical protein ACI89X_001058 [Planctomycetota bacterium]|jgi:hypothetical protein
METLAKLAVLAVLACPGAAQNSTEVEQCLEWIVSGEQPKKTRFPTMLMRALVNGDAEKLALAVSERVEHTKDPKQRARATELLAGSLQAQAFDTFEDEVQEKVARALVHATSDPDLDAHRLGLAIAATAQLKGRPERKQWLLEGQVRLRRLLNPKLKEDWPDTDVVQGIFLYYYQMDRDALPAFEVLIGLFEKGVLHSSHDPQLTELLALLARHSPDKLMPRVFEAFANTLANPKPRSRGIIATRLTKVAMAHPKLMNRESVLKTLPPMISTLANGLAGIEQPAPADRATIKLLREIRAGCTRIRDPKQRNALIAHGRGALAPFERNKTIYIRELAKVWLR